MWDCGSIRDIDGIANAVLFSLLILYGDWRKGWVLPTALRLLVRYCSCAEWRAFGLG